MVGLHDCVAVTTKKPYEIQLSLDAATINTPKTASIHHTIRIRPQTTLINIRRTILQIRIHKIQCERIAPRRVRSESVAAVAHQMEANGKSRQKKAEAVSNIRVSKTLSSINVNEKPPALKALFEKRDKLRQENLQLLRQQCIKENFLDRHRETPVIAKVVEKETYNKATIEDRHLLQKLRERDHLSSLFLKSYEEYQELKKKEDKLKSEIKAQESEINRLQFDLGASQSDHFPNKKEETKEFVGLQKELKSLQELYTIYSNVSSQMVLASGKKWEGTNLEHLVRSADKSVTADAFADGVFSG
ncbi:hypothetical protein HDU97_007796 [Phlyctochytrium planicorne]|nr:hypothetical protein HDU97_007796 [Phlyctochytrium planicorne]